MNAIVDAALDLWGLTGATYRLVAARENAVFEVTQGQTHVALRLHRAGYRTDAELRSELQWMDAAAKGGITVPMPVASETGHFLHIVQGVQVDVLSWLHGRPIGNAADPLIVPDRTGVMARLGQQMARLHDISDAWTPAPGFTRCAWDRPGLLGDQPLWDRFWENPGLSPDDQQLFMRLRTEADARLTVMETQLDFGLIHADLVSANVLYDGTELAFIDFDDGGYGYRPFDLATVLLRQTPAPDYFDLRAALIDGYTSVRQIDLDALDLFLFLRAVTYVGWNIKRMEEDGGLARNDRFIQTARQMGLAIL